MSVALRDGELVVSVADTGPGMSSQHLARLFKPFSQVGGERFPFFDVTMMSLSFQWWLSPLPLSPLFKPFSQVNKEGTFLLLAQPRCRHFGRLLRPRRSP